MPPPPGGPLAAAVSLGLMLRLTRVWPGPAAQLRQHGGGGAGWGRGGCRRRRGCQGTLQQTGQLSPVCGHAHTRRAVCGEGRGGGWLEKTSECVRPVLSPDLSLSSPTSLDLISHFSPSSHCSAAPPVFTTTGPRPGGSGSAPTPPPPAARGPPPACKPAAAAPCATTTATTHHRPHRPHSSSLPPVGHRKCSRTTAFCLSVRVRGKETV